MTLLSGNLNYTISTHFLMASNNEKNSLEIRFYRTIIQTNTYQQFHRSHSVLFLNLLVGPTNHLNQIGNKFWYQTYSLNSNHIYSHITRRIEQNLDELVSKNSKMYCFSMCVIWNFISPTLPVVMNIWKNWFPLVCNEWISFQCFPTGNKQFGYYLSHMKNKQTTGQWVSLVHLFVTSCKLIESAIYARDSNIVLRIQIMFPEKLFYKLCIRI